MLTIRLQRGGKRNTPQYKVVLAQKTAANQKQFVEVLGSYNPHTKELGIRSNDRLNYWMNDQHVELSATVHNLFVTKDLLKADKTKSFTIPKKEVVAEAPAEAASAEPAAEATTTEVTEEVKAQEPEMVVAVEEVNPESTPAEVETPEVVAEPAAEPTETPVEEKAE